MCSEAPWKVEGLIKKLFSYVIMLEQEKYSFYIKFSKYLTSRLHLHSISCHEAPSSWDFDHGWISVIVLFMFYRSVPSCRKSIVLSKKGWPTFCPSGKQKWWNIWWNKPVKYLLNRTHKLKSEAHRFPMCLWTALFMFEVHISSRMCAPVWLWFCLITHF